MAENCRLCNWDNNLISYYVPKAKTHENKIEVLLPKVKLNDIKIEILDSTLILQAINNKQKKKYKRKFKLDQNITLDNLKLVKKGDYLNILFEKM